MQPFQAPLMTSKAGLLFLTGGINLISYRHSGTAWGPNYLETDRHEAWGRQKGRYNHHQHCCHKTYFTNPILIHMRFSFITVYINFRQNRQCLRGYSPGWQFFRHFVCIWHRAATRTVRYDDIYWMEEIKSLSFHIMFYRLFRGVAKYIVSSNTFSSFEWLRSLYTAPPRGVKERQKQVEMRTTSQDKTRSLFLIEGLHL